MIFRQWKLVLSGEKTQTRRVKKKGEMLVPNRLHSNWPFPPTVLKDGRVKWMIGKTYAVQPGRGKKAVGRIRLTGIREARLQHISHEDIEVEGIPKSLCFYYVDDLKDFDAEEHRYLFEELWDGINSKKGDRWEDNPIVWVLEFELVEGG